MSSFLLYIILGSMLLVFMISHISYTIIGLILICLLYLGYLIKKRFKMVYLVFYIISCLFFAGYIQAYNQVFSIGTEIKSQHHSGYVLAVKETENSMKYTIFREHSLLLHETILVFTSKDEQVSHISIGDTVTVTCKLEPIIAEDNFLLFNYTQYAKSTGIHHQCYAKKMLVEERLGILTIPLKIKQHIIEYFQQFPQIILPYLHAFILGDTGYFGEKQQLFVEIGIAHILALSSSQIQFFKKAFFISGRKIRLTKEQIIFCFLLFLSVYTSMLHNNISFLRAVISSFCLQIIEDVLGRKATKEDKMCVLLGTAGVFILINPYVIYNLGFQYTFLCSLFLQIYGARSKKDGWLVKVGDAVRVNIACVLITLPITAYAQQELSVFPMISTLVFSPIFSVIIGLSWLMCFFPFMAVYIQPFFSYAEKLFEFSQKLNQFIYVPLYFQIEGFVLLFCILYILDIYFKKRWKHRTIQICSVVVYVISMYTINISLNSIHFLSLPYGETTIITVGGMVYMIDTGGAQKDKDNIYIVEKIIMPFLEKLNIKKIDVLILTHDDIDHTGAAKELLTRIPIDVLYLNFQSEEESMYQQILQNTAQKTDIVRVREQLVLRHFVLLPIILSSENNNDTSLVVYGLFGGRKWLFMGDLEQRGEKELIKQFPRLKVDVLKIGHHGSRTSTTEDLLQKLQPKYGIINVQMKNIYQHPHNEVEQRLQKYNVTYWVTNRDGSQSYFFLGPFSFFRH